MSVQIEDLELLDAVRDFALHHPHPDVRRFHASMRDWGDSWRAVTPAYLAAADLLHASLLTINPGAETLMSVFARHNKRLRWEQSYKKEEGLVPDAMLAGYGFAEIIGRHGPFISERIVVYYLWQTGDLRQQSQFGE